MRRILTLLTAVLLVATLTPAVLATDPYVYTGCLSPGGTLYKIAIGEQPAKPCSDDQIQVSWDRAGPAFEERIAALEARVAELEEPFGALELSVDCAAGETVGAALAQAQDHPGPVNIAISGVCEENVLINRHDVNIHGQQRSDGIRAGGPAWESAVSLRSARDVQLANMTISGGRRGISAGEGSAFTASDVTVRETTQWAIEVEAGSTLDLSNCSIDGGAGFGITAWGGDINMRNCSVSGYDRYGVLAQHGGRVFVVDSTIFDNDEGVTAAYGAAVRISGSTIEGNRNGVDALAGSSIDVNGSRVANNGEAGALAGLGSSLNISNTVIENNGAQGILAHGSSIVEVRDVTVRDNQSDGIALLDLSYGFAIWPVDPNVEITDNGGWGINCAGPSAITEAQNGFPIALITFSGNTAGDTNCP